MVFSRSVISARRSQTNIFPMSVKTCPDCGSLQARGRFCSQCGYDLSTVKEKPEIPDPPRRDYEALRFTSSMIVLFGWVIVVASLFTSAYYYSQYTVSGNAIVRQGQSDAPSYDPNKTISPIVPAAIAIFGVISGTLTIAAGQIIMVFLDIRDDVRILKLRE